MSEFTFSISLTTVDRPVPHRLNLLKRLSDSGTLTHSGFRGIHIRSGIGQGTNTARTLRAATNDNASWVIHFEDDIDLIDDFAGSLERWLSDYATPDVLVYPLGCNHHKLFRRGMTALPYPLKHFYGCCGLALRVEDARHLVECLEQKPSWFRFEEYGLDHLVKRWHQHLRPQQEYLLTPVPCFINHVGLVSSQPDATLDPTHYTGPYPGFGGRGYSYHTQPRPSPVLVLIASVPARRANLKELLNDVANQTHPPDRSLVLLDGGENEPLQADEVVHHRIPRGAGERWRFLTSDARYADSTVLVLDDDLRLDPDYIERTLRELDQLNVPLVAWNGHRSPRHYIHLKDNPDRAHGLWSAGTGTSAFRLRYLYGVTEHAWAESMLGVGGDDEFLVSTWFRQHGWSMVRPQGKAPLREVDALQYSPDSSHARYGKAWDQFRQAHP